MLQRADHIFQFSFPKDHGQHRNFRTEWWYLSGRLSSNAETDYAYHFTIFRRALIKWSHLALVGLAIKSKSIHNIALFKRAFARMLANQDHRRICVDGYVGHLTITCVKEKEFVFFETGGTSLLEVAGATEDSLCVWVKGWKLKEERGVLNLAAGGNDFAIDLDVLPMKPPIINGIKGLSIKGPAHGEASYHYSLAPLQTMGSLIWRGITYEVDGASFMDREFGTSMLPLSVRGWDWFGLILDNNHEAMIYLIRNSDGTIAVSSSGTVVFPDGTTHCVESVDLHVEVVELWTSPTTGALYPVQWIVGVEPMNLKLKIRALVKEHEIFQSAYTTINYWEGPVSVSGIMDGLNVTGHGHVELVGYAESAGGKF